jgi:hypothetical protein
MELLHPHCAGLEERCAVAQDHSSAMRLGARPHQGQLLPGPIPPPARPPAAPKKLSEP